MSEKNYIFIEGSAGDIDDPGAYNRRVISEALSEVGGIMTAIEEGCQVSLEVPSAGQEAASTIEVLLVAQGILSIMMPGREGPTGYHYDTTEASIRYVVGGDTVYTIAIGTLDGSPYFCEAQRLIMLTRQLLREKTPVKATPTQGDTLERHTGRSAGSPVV